MKEEIRKRLDVIVKLQPELLADACMYYLEVGEITPKEYMKYKRIYEKVVLKK